MNSVSTPFNDVATNYYSEIAYPNDLTQHRTHTFLIGWNLKHFRCSIIGIIELPSNKLNELKNALMLCCDGLTSNLAVCSSDGTLPTVIGEWYPNDTDLNRIDNSFILTENIWLVLTVDESLKPILHSLHAVGSQYHVACTMIEYQRLNTDYMYCLDFEDNYTETDTIYNRIQLKTHFDYISQQINISYDLETAIRVKLQLDIRTPSNYQLLLPLLNRTKSWLSVFWFFLIAHLAWLSYIGVLALKYICSCQIELYWLGILISNCINLPSLHIYEMNKEIFNNDVPRSIKPVTNILLLNVSFTSNALYLKAMRTTCSIYNCGLFTKVWTQLPTPYRKKLWDTNMSCVVLTLLDVCFGLLIGIFMLHHSHPIAHNALQIFIWLEKECIIDFMQKFHQDWGGIKLNSIITINIANVLQLFIKFYGIIIRETVSYHVTIIQFIALSGSIGLTVQISIVMDIIHVLSFHIYLIHRLLAWQHQHHLKLIYTFYLLFNGKKQNILRKRIDTCEFGKNQLMFGILIFAILLFTLPSFGIFFYLFAILQLWIGLLQYVLWITSMLINEFPWYELIVQTIYPKYYMTGVQICPMHHPNTTIEFIYPENIQTTSQSKFHAVDNKFELLTSTTIEKNRIPMNEMKSKNSKKVVYNDNRPGILKSSDKIIKMGSKENDGNNVTHEEIELLGSNKVVRFQLIDTEELITSSSNSFNDTSNLTLQPHVNGNMQYMKESENRIDMKNQPMNYHISNDKIQSDSRHDRVIFDSEQKLSSDNLSINSVQGSSAEVIPKLATSTLSSLSSHKYGSLDRHSFLSTTTAVEYATTYVAMNLTFKSYFTIMSRFGSRFIKLITSNVFYRIVRIIALAESSMNLLFLAMTRNNMQSMIFNLLTEYDTALEWYENSNSNKKTMNQSSNMLKNDDSVDSQTNLLPTLAIKDDAFRDQDVTYNKTLDMNNEEESFTSNWNIRRRSLQNGRTDQDKQSQSHSEKNKQVRFEQNFGAMNYDSEDHLGFDSIHWKAKKVAYWKSVNSAINPEPGPVSTVKKTSRMIWLSYILLSSTLLMLIIHGLSACWITSIVINKYMSGTSNKLLPYMVSQHIPWSGFFMQILRPLQSSISNFLNYMNQALPLYSYMNRVVNSTHIHNQMVNDTTLNTHHRMIFEQLFTHVPME